MEYSDFTIKLLQSATVKLNIIKDAFEDLLNLEIAVDVLEILA